MTTYEGFVIKAGPEIEPKVLLAISEIGSKKKCYMIRNEDAQKVFEKRWGQEWDHMNYAVDKVTKKKKGTLLKWRIHENMDYIQLYWLPFGCKFSKLENGKHIYIIRTKFRVLFKCILRLLIIARRVKIRLQTRKSLNVASIFRKKGVGHVYLNRIISTFI